MDRAKFEAAYQSFSVAAQVRRPYNCKTSTRWKAPGPWALPALLPDGSMAGGFERMIQITNQLIEQERKRT